MCNQCRRLFDVGGDFAHFTGRLLNHLRALLGDFARLYRDVISLAGTAGIPVMLLDPRRHIGRELDHFAQTPTRVVHRVVVGLQPNALPALIDALKLAVEKLTVIESAPEVLIRAAVDQLGRTEQSMMFTFEFGEGVTHARQKILISADDSAVEVKLDHRHGAVDRLQPGSGFAFVLHSGGHVHCIFDHLHDVARRVNDRVVTGLQPDRSPVATHPFIRPRLELAVLKSRPQLRILLAARVLGWAKLPMRLPQHLITPIARGLQKVVVGAKHDAIEIEFDHCHGAINRFQQGILAVQVLLKGVDGGFMASK